MSSIPLPLPSDFTWGVRFGMLEDLLNKDAQSRDPDRSSYAAQRYDQAVQLAAMSSSLFLATCNGASLPVSSLQELDSFYANWRNETGPPQALAVAGRNLVVVAPVPDGAYTITLDAVVNAPVAASAGGSDAIALHADLVDALVDYAVHLAAFKMGGAEFIATMPYFKRFLELARKYRGRLDAEAIFEKALQMFPGKENERTPYNEEDSK